MMSTLVRNKPKYSPWGAIQQERQHGPGIVNVSTSSHGGYKLDRARNAKIPAAFRNPRGWYEEDVEAAIVIYFLHDGFKFAPITPVDIEDAARDLKCFYPHEWEAVTGTLPQLHESTVLREEKFEVDTFDKYVCHAAVGSATMLPPNTVGAYCLRKSDMSRKFFHVDKDRYDNRCYNLRPHHVVDEAIDVEAKPFDPWDATK